MVRVHLSPFSLKEKLSNGGVAQLGEHLPCKQGVMSSNLTISIRKEISELPVETDRHSAKRMQFSLCENLVHWKLYIESKRILILLIIVRSIVRHPNYSIWFFKNRTRNHKPVLKACFYKAVLITSSGRSPTARKLVFERVLEKNKIERQTDWMLLR